IGEDRLYYGHILGLIHYTNGDFDEAMKEFKAYGKYHGTRGDPVNEFIAICYQAGLSSITGEIDFGFRNYKPYMETGRSLSLLWYGTVPYQICCYFIYMGNIEEARRLCEICQDVQSTLDNFPLIKQAGAIPVIWLCTIDPTENAVRDFILKHAATSTLWESFEKGSIGVLEALNHVTFATCMALMPMVRNGRACSLYERFSEEQKRHFDASLLRFETVNKRMGVTKRFPMMWIPWLLIKACIDYSTSRHLKKPKSRHLKALKMLRGSLTKTKSAKILEKLLTQRAMTFWMLGIFLPSKPEIRKVYLNEAMAIYNKMGAAGMVKIIGDYLGYGYV
ncbi:hypothetical protein HDU67_002604, partial [Dinochytrium kinnereticum]